MLQTIHLVLVALAGAASSTAVRAEIIDVAWGEQGRFERRLTVPPAKFAEVCGKLARADEVAWRFEAGGPLDFNIHYHEGKAVKYPARQNATAGATGTLRVAQDQDYCWMWTNKSGSPVRLHLVLER